MTKINIFDDIKNQPNEKLQALKQLLPNLFDQDGNLIESELKQFAKQNYEKPDFETFQFNWAGKTNAKKIAHEHYVAGTLEPDETRSKNIDKTENLIIEGDNLQVLHLLKKSYKNKVKCIYIDPPYNTGNDFVYNDKFELNIKTYLQETGEIDIETGEQLADYITKDDGRKHSKWLSFMYPRLHLARELLRDDGVIFISIDDNEVANLKLMMNEVFGESEFVGCFIKQSKVGGGSDSKHIVKEHEYIFCYAKDISSLEDFFIDHDLFYLKRYKEEDEKGKYFWDTFARPGLKNPIKYDIIVPDGTIVSGEWIRSKKRFDEDYANGEIRIIKKNDKSWSVQFKQRLNLDGKKPRSMTTDFGGTIDGKDAIQELFNDDKIFSYPKSPQMIKHLLQISTKPNDIILDFFAGSGTTGQAVMELNQEEIDKKAQDGMFETTETKGNRKFILVQLPEKIDAKKEAFKAGYKKISDITIERVKRAGEKYKSVDNGFKVLKLSENLEKNSMFDGVIGKNNEAIFTHLALYYGYGLNYSTEKISSTKQIYILKPQFDKTKNAIIILEKTLITQDDIMHLIKNYGEQEYKFFARDVCLNMELTYNLLQHFKKDNIIVF